MSIFDQAARISRGLGPLGVVPAIALETTGAAVRTGERVALRLLRDRLDTVAPALPASAPAPADPQETPAGLMVDLLERGLAQDTAAGRTATQLAILRQLLPDEARILAALAQGVSAPVVHVSPRAGGPRLLENASLIGRQAALTLPSRTPAYVTHLRALGLVETAPEQPGIAQDYEMLMADKAVRAALKEGELSKLPAKVVRRTLVLTDEGRALWEATQP